MARPRKRTAKASRSSAAKSDLSRPNKVKASTAAAARTQKKKQAFLEALRQYGNVSKVCEDLDIPRQSIYDARRADEDFARAWDAVMDESVALLEDEAHRRAYSGTTKPVYQGGVRVGEIQEYSDTLLIFLLKANRPAKYKESVDHTIRGTAGVLVAPVPMDGSTWQEQAQRLNAPSTPDDHQT